MYCHSPPALEDSNAIIEDEEYQCETLLTAIKNTNNSKKLQKLQVIEAEVKAATNSAEIDNELDDFDSILGGTSEDGKADNGQKRGKAHKSIKVSIFTFDFERVNPKLRSNTLCCLLCRNGAKRGESYGTKIPMAAIQIQTLSYLELQVQGL